MCWKFHILICQYAVNTVRGTYTSVYKIFTEYLLQYSKYYSITAYMQKKSMTIPANILESCFANVSTDSIASSMHDIPLLIHFFAEAGPTPYTPVNVYKVTN